MRVMRLKIAAGLAAAITVGGAVTGVASGRFSASRQAVAQTANAASVANAAAQGGNRTYIKPLTVPLTYAGLALTRDGDTLSLASNQGTVWSGKAAPDLTWTFTANDGKTTLRDDRNNVILSRTFAAPDLVMTVVDDNQARLTDRDGQTLWTGIIQGPATGEPSVSPIPMGPVSSGTQNGVFVEEAWSQSEGAGSGDRIHYRLEHRLGIAHPEGDIVILTLESRNAQAGSVPTPIWTGHVQNPGLDVRTNSSRVVMGLEGYPITPTFEITYNIHFRRGTAQVSTADGTALGAEPVYLGSYTAKATAPGTGDWKRYLNAGEDVVVPEDRLFSFGESGAKYQIKFLDEHGSIVQSEAVSIDNVEMPPYNVQGQKYKIVKGKRDIFDPTGKLCQSTEYGGVAVPM